MRAKGAAAVIGALACGLGSLGCGGRTLTTPTVPLTLSCNVTPTAGIAPLTVSLVVQISPASAILNVQYGDGTSSNNPNATHVYKTPGSYGLVVNATSGSQQTSCQSSISVSAPPPPPPNTAPVPRFRISPNPPVGPAPFDVNFNMCGSTDSDGDALTFIYNFGDGTSHHSSFCRDDHVYAQGTYSTQMCVTDGQPGHEICQNNTVQAQ